MESDVLTVGIPHEKLAPILDKLKKRVFTNDVVKDIFDKYDIDEEELYLIPMLFADDLGVSAQCNHGIIYINIQLLDGYFKGEDDIDDVLDEIDHYLAHEITHFAQQTTGNKPTPGSTNDNYLDNPAEQEGFRNQTKYISETKGDEEAEEYIDQVLDYHNKNDADDKKMEERRDKLLDFAFLMGIDIKKLS